VEHFLVGLAKTNARKAQHATYVELCLKNPHGKWSRFFVTVLDIVAENCAIFKQMRESIT